MKLYTTPPSILTLVTWVSQNRQGKSTPHSGGAPHPLCSNEDPQSSGLSSLKGSAKPGGGG